MKILKTINGVMLKRKFKYLFFVLLLLVLPMSAWAEDSEINRQTLAGINGVLVVIEDLQPNITKYSQKADLTKDQLQKLTEGKLKKANINSLSVSDVTKLPGKPILYICINTHENEKYVFAYYIDLQLRQVVSLEANPQIKTIATTWSLNLTGIADIGHLQVINKDLQVLLDRFIAAHRAANSNKKTE
jgi:hypothetical protein